MKLTLKHIVQCQYLFIIHIVDNLLIGVLAKFGYRSETTSKYYVFWTTCWNLLSKCGKFSFFSHKIWLPCNFCRICIVFFLGGHNWQNFTKKIKIKIKWWKITKSWFVSSFSEKKIRQVAKMLPSKNK
jgi:hypothetical protein